MEGLVSAGVPEWAPPPPPPQSSARRVHLFFTFFQHISPKELGLLPEHCC